MFVAVDGGWSGWSSWSPCGKTCGGGLRERTRSCTNPPPFFGGKGCGTHYYESKECAMNTCPGKHQLSHFSFVCVPVCDRSEIYETLLLRSTSTGKSSPTQKYFLDVQGLKDV